MPMKAWKAFVFALLLVVLIAAIGAGLLIHHGFRATNKPSSFEVAIARAARDYSIPNAARNERNPIHATSQNLQDGRDAFLAHCQNCHGHDASGLTPMGQSLYPRVPDLRAEQTQNLTDGEIHYIIENGVQLTGMPAWGNPQEAQNDDLWKLVLYIRSLRPLTQQEQAQQRETPSSAHYVGSQACEKCHAEIYQHWQKTPMANIVRDPRTHPDAIIPDLATNHIYKFSKDQVAFVYGSVWKQRYFTKVGDEYFPLPVQWEVKNKKWSKYVVPATGADWWTPYYPGDNMHRSTAPLCDGCHSVGYNIRTRQVAEWNVGCERCHGPGSEHVARPAGGNIINPAHMDYVAATDTCIQCHSQGQPLSNPIEGKYYDWPVGYHVGLKLADYWKLEDHILGAPANFLYFPDGTAHKNRMQGNDFVQSVMYRRGITCFDCHDAHGTGNYAQLRKPAQQLCLDCHGPSSPNGPRTATIEEHTHHKVGSPGNQCVACHMPAIETEGPANTFVHAHTFRFITPAMTEKYKIPNPCTSCHADKTIAWATSAMRGWTERSPWRIAQNPTGN
ncbi:MAG TPA: c-type cytochrome [Candidatus Acidoferrales bacterium]|nr:c-type cytochrome [Candidatus Acidoferrales bacterium]